MFEKLYPLEIVVYWALVGFAVGMIISVILGKFSGVL